MIYFAMFLVVVIACVLGLAAIEDHEAKKELEALQELEDEGYEVIYFYEI